MKTKIANSWKEWQQLKAENEEYHNSHCHRNKFDIEVPNFLGYIDVDDAHICPKCQSRNVEAVNECKNCNSTGWECHDCPAFWQTKYYGELEP